jgi:long-chain acyl-CoA synthetase
MLYRDMIHTTVNRYPDKPAVVCGKQQDITNREMHENSNAIIAGFHDAGLKKGDKIALWIGNCHHYRQMFWVAGKAGFVVIPVNGRLKPQEAAYILNNSEAKCIVVSKEFHVALEEIKSELDTVDHFFGIDPGLEGCTDLDDVVRDYPAGDPDVHVTEDDLLWFQYTSGTTGLPKGAMHTQSVPGALVEIPGEVLLDLFEPDHEPRFLQVVPSSSISGIGWDMIYQWAGALVVIMEKFDPSHMMALVEKHGITDTHIVPAMLNFILSSPDFGKYDLSSLKCITYGASPMPPSLVRKGIEKIGPIFMQDYGASECGALTFLSAEDHVLDGPPEQVRRLGSCGKPIPGAGVRCLNDRGEPIRPGEIGELTTKSPMVMKGYWKMPEETKGSIRDGIFYTGDLVTVDEDGYIYVMDRKKDMIISGGFNIYPNELENVLFKHPAVADAAVFGIPDDTWGEAVCAHVVLRPEARITEEEIIGFMKENLAGYKKPKLVKFVKEIPKTHTGKTLKKDLRAKYWEGRDRRV